MSIILLFKLCSTPLIIWLSVLTARRWGPFVGGCIAGLPSISGPISLCIALEQGSHFAAQAAYNALLGVGAVCLFTLVYAWMALRRPWYLALAVAELTYFVVGWGVGLVPSSIPLAVVVGLAGPLVALRGMPRLPEGVTPPARPQAPWIVPTQMLLGALLVFSITEAAHVLGPQWSGVLAFYPVMISILAPFCHVSLGAYAARALLSGLMTGFIGGTSFYVVVLFAVEQLSLSQCYLLATTLSLLLCTVAGLIQRRFRERRSEGFGERRGEGLGDNFGESHCNQCNHHDHHDDNNTTRAAS